MSAHLLSVGGVNAPYLDGGRGQFDPEHDFVLGCTAFFVTALWLEGLLHLAWPSADLVMLPKRFRSVLFLDVFGVADDIKQQAHHPQPDQDDEPIHEISREQAEEADTAVSDAESAVRRWAELPKGSNEAKDIKGPLENLRSKVLTWRKVLNGEAARRAIRRGDTADLDALRPDTRTWGELTEEEQEEDPFRGSLLGPFHQDNEGVYYYDVERRSFAWQPREGQGVLTIQQVRSLVETAEARVRELFPGRSDFRMPQLEHMSDGSDQTDIAENECMEELRSCCRCWCRRRGEMERERRLPWRVLLSVTRVKQVSWPCVSECRAKMKVCLAAALAAAFTATAMSQDSPAELLRELQAQRELLEEQRKELKQMAETQESMAGAMDSAWLVLCGALVMFMHAGFAMLETGCCRAKNASNVLMKNLVSVGTLGWWIFGWAFAYGSQAGSFIGTDGFFGIGFYNKDASGNIVPVECEDGNCQLTSVIWCLNVGATIVSGCVAERVKSPTYAVFAFCMTSFIYPVIVAWTWGGGWLASIFDVAVSAPAGVVHFTGGVCGLAGTVILGPRKGRFENPEEFEYHNIPLRPVRTRKQRTLVELAIVTWLALSYALAQALSSSCVGKHCGFGLSGCEVVDTENVWWPCTYTVTKALRRALHLHRTQVQADPPSRARQDASGSTRGWAQATLKKTIMKKKKTFEKKGHVIEMMRLPFLSWVPGLVQELRGRQERVFWVNASDGGEPLLATRTWEEQLDVYSC
eukprot:s3707_g6.t1